jgi:hypothetical protein
MYNGSLVSAEAQASYLRRVTALTLVGLGISGAVSVVSALMLALVPALLTGFLPMLLILGCWAITNFVAQPMVFGSLKIPGFLLGMVTQGAAMGFLLLAAVAVGSAVLSNPLVLIALAAGLTFFAAMGMAAYTWIAPRNFSLIGGFLSAVSIPMMIVMAVGIAFPGLFGGGIGIGIAAVFTLFSAGALVYQLNEVINRFRHDMVWEGAYTIAMGILVLFWNILSLLMRITRR